jgi:hypothetical protein
MSRIAAALSVLALISFVAIGIQGQETKGTQKKPRGQPERGQAQKLAQEKAPAAEPVPLSKAGEIRTRLAQPVNLEKGIETSQLKDALEFIGQKFGIAIVIDRQAFKDDYQIDSVDEQQVRLPRLAGIKLGTVLRLLVSQVGGNQPAPGSGSGNGTYLVRGDHVEITTEPRTNPAFWRDPDLDKYARRKLALLIDADFRQRPLAEALFELSDESGISIVLDVRAVDAAKIPVSATFKGTPLDTAVETLASMAGMRMVAQDRALYVAPDFPNAAAARKRPENVALKQD